MLQRIVYYTRPFILCSYRNFSVPGKVVVKNKLVREDVLSPKQDRHCITNKKLKDKIVELEKLAKHRCICKNLKMH